MAERIFAVTRSFQGGATFTTFDSAKFEKGVAAPIRKLIGTAPPELAGVIVVTCGEPGSKYAEQVETHDDDRQQTAHTPTTQAICRMFRSVADPEQSVPVVPVICEHWGLNPGSATAINEGIKVAKGLGATKVLVWSPEIDLSGHMLYLMNWYMGEHALGLVGYLRNRWYERLQWQFAQNTCALWDMALLDGIGGFNPLCNGDGKTVVETIEYGAVPLAGMEDFEAYLRASKLLGSFVRWGAIGKHDPAYWNLALKRPGTPEFENNVKKIARQGLVMDAWARQNFPELEPLEVYDRVMQVSSRS